MADVPDSKSGPRKRVWVQVPPSVLGTYNPSSRAPGSSIDGFGPLLELTEGGVYPNIRWRSPGILSVLVGFDHTQCASVRANSWSAKQMRRRSAKRSLDFVAMEHRVTMSAGMPDLGATLPVHAVISAQTEHAEGASSEVPRVRLAVSAALPTLTAPSLPRRFL